MASEQVIHDIRLNMNSILDDKEYYLLFSEKACNNFEYHFKLLNLGFLLEKIEFYISKR
jgi:hypothetical protein